MDRTEEQRLMRLAFEKKREAFYVYAKSVRNEIQDGIGQLLEAANKLVATESSDRGMSDIFAHELESLITGLDNIQQLNSIPHQGMLEMTAKELCKNLSGIDNVCLR